MGAPPRHLALRRRIRTQLTSLARSYNRRQSWATRTSSLPAQRLLEEALKPRAPLSLRRASPDPWPRAGLNSLADFFALGYKIALVTSSVSMAGLAGARAMLLELRNSGRQEEYFARAPGFHEVERWYRDLGFRPTKPFV